MILNGWASSKEAWSLCEFAKEKDTHYFSYADQLDGKPEEFLEATNDALIVGWSMGSSSAMRMALKFTDKIKGLVLLAPTPRMLDDKENGWIASSERRVAAFEEGLRITLGKGFIDLNEGLPNPFEFDSEENLARGIAYLRETDLRAPLLEKFGPKNPPQFPIAIFHSEKDGVVKPYATKWLKENVFTTADVEMIPGSEHALPIRIPKKIDEIVAKFKRLILSLIISFFAFGAALASNGRDGSPLPSVGRDGSPLPSIGRDGSPLPSIGRDGSPLPSEKEIICENGICRLPEDMLSTTKEIKVSEDPSRVAYGFMDSEEFISFIKGENKVQDVSSWWVILILALFGGFMMNLTPCVLPLIPVQIILIGASAKRGLIYGLGMAFSFGVLGLLAAFGGVAFGALQSSVWFNASVAVIFLMLSLASAGFFTLDFSNARMLAISGAKKNLSNVFLPFVMGVFSAILAGACVAPMLIAVLLMTTELSAKGNMIAYILPFIFGLGMALPWPFVGGGLKVLPRPGAWLKIVNKIFAIIVLFFALWYGYLAINGFMGRHLNLQGTEFVVSNLDSFDLSKYPRPLLIDCWASWCKNCSAMEKTTLMDERVKRELDGWTFIRLQAEDINELKKLPQFKDIKGLPAFYIFEKGCTTKRKKK